MKIPTWDGAPDQRCCFIPASVKPGEMPSVQMAHGSAGAGPDGAIYASPSLWLASHPVYSTLLQLDENR
jgi:hypothetical protein